MIEAPPFTLSEREAHAWRRIVSNLQARGAWRPAYGAAAHSAARAAAAYVAGASTLPHTPREELRACARTWLVTLGYVPAWRERLAVVTPEGLDADLVALCAAG